MICSSCNKDYLRDLGHSLKCFACGSYASAKYALPYHANGYRTFPGAISLDSYQITWLKEKYGLSENQIKEFDLSQCDYRGKTWIYLPIWGNHGTEVHAQLRFYGETTNDKKYKTISTPPRGLLWFSEYYRGYLLGDKFPKLVLCEGIFDAVRCSEFCPSIAILGSYLTKDQKSAILNISKSDTEFIVMLDSDAFKEAYKISKWLGHGRTRIVQFEADPTDETSEALKKYLL